MKTHYGALLCTLGPASLNDRVIYCLEQAGASVLRINLSHTKIEDLERIITFIQKRTSLPICLDTEGAQVRTGPMVDGRVTVRENGLVTVHARPVPGDALNISFYPATVVAQLRGGDFISIDFNSVLAQVVETREGSAVLRVLNGGAIGRNKAVTILRTVQLPPLTDKDIAAISIGKEMGISHYALSFAHRESDVDLIRKLAGPGSVVISKIECLSGLTNLDAIASKSDAILIDRGDLSREVPIEQIPATQKMIIRRSRALGTKLYVATNLLESMTSSPTPTRAEVNDIYNTLEDGADGLVLAAETAIGDYPIECAKMVVKVMEQFEKRADFNKTLLPLNPSSLLVEPHGGYLVTRPKMPPDDEALSGLPEIMVGDEELTDVEQISYGTYSPLTGFMDKDTLSRVLDENLLASGLAWTMPIVLPISAETAKRHRKGDCVILCRHDGLKHSLLEISEIFQFDRTKLERKWFGTDASTHPGVARIRTRGDHFLAGEVTLLNTMPLPYRLYDLTPAQLRAVFTHKGWSSVVGFHTRNLVHRGHETIQLAALERTHADGLLISPVVGVARRGDFLPEVILDGYQTMLDYGLYPQGRVVLASFISYPRFAGPREAVFTALCRKNMGCSHFIVGRDHSGVGNFYGMHDAHALFDRLGDIGIEPVYFDAVGYDAVNERYVELGGGALDAAPISGTEIRRALSTGERLPSWMVRSEVLEVVRSKQSNHASLFQE
jgi:pyruvate kinase